MTFRLGFAAGLAFAGICLFSVAALSAEAKIGVSAKIVNGTAKAEIIGPESLGDWEQCMKETERPDYCLPLVEPEAGEDVQTLEDGTVIYE